MVCFDSSTVPLPYYYVVIVLFACCVSGCFFLCIIDLLVMIAFVILF